VPHAIGSTAFGELSLAGAITSLAGALLGLSMGTLLIKKIAVDPSRAKDYLGAALTIRLLFAVPLVLIVVGISAVGGYDPQTRLVIYAATSGMLVGFLTGPLGAVLMAFEKMHFTTLSDIVTNGVLSLVVVALVWFASVNAVGIALVGLSAAMLVAILETCWVARIVRIRPSFDMALMRSLIVGSLPFAITFLFLSFYTWIDTVMLSFMTTEKVVGWYGAATRLFTALLFVPTTFTTALFPALTYSFKHDQCEMARQVRQSFTLITSLSVPIAVGCVLLAPGVVQLVYGPNFAPSGTVLMVLGLALVPMYLNILVNQILLASDRQVVWTVVMGVMCLVNPAINLATISYFQHAHQDGALGAAWAMVATEGLMGVIGLVVLPRGLLGWKAATPLIRSAVAAGIMAAVIWPLRDLFVFIPIAVGTLVYFGLAIVLRVFPAEDMAILGGLVAKILRKLGLRYRLRSSAADQAIGLPPTALDAFVEDLRVWQRHSAGAQGGQAAAETLLRLRDIVGLIWAQPGVRATLVYRLSAEAKRLRMPAIPGMLARHNVRRFGLDVEPSTVIGPGLYLPYPVATVIRASAVGRNCYVAGAATIGPRDLHEYPTIGDNVYIGADARVLGGIHLGDGVRIGANAVVLRDVPAGATAAGIPARVLVHADAVWAEQQPEANAGLVLLPASDGRSQNGHHNGNDTGDRVGTRRSY
jgi:serine O-acetyltransferase